MLRQTAAVPPDVRKGGAFPLSLIPNPVRLRLTLAASPQNLRERQPERRRLSADRWAKPKKSFLRNLNDNYFMIELIIE